MDVLGSFDRVDLYRALIVDARSRDCAQLLLAAAVEDPMVTDGQEGDLIVDYRRNHEIGAD